MFILVLFATLTLILVGIVYVISDLVRDMKKQTIFDKSDKVVNKFFEETEDFIKKTKGR